MTERDADVAYVNGVIIKPVCGPLGRQEDCKYRLLWMDIVLPPHERIHYLCRDGAWRQLCTSMIKGHTSYNPTHETMRFSSVAQAECWLYNNPNPGPWDPEWKEQQRVLRELEKAAAEAATAAVR